MSNITYFTFNSDKSNQSCLNADQQCDSDEFHQDEKHSDKKQKSFQICPNCDKTFEYKSLLTRHLESCNRNQKKFLAFQKSYNDLVIEHNKCKDENKTLQQTLNDVKKEYEQLQRTSKEYRSNKDYFEKVNFTLQESIKDCKKENNVLQLKYNELDTENKLLKNKQVLLEKELYHLEKETKSLSQTLEKKDEKIIENNNINVTLQLNQINQQINIDGKVNYKTIVEKLPCVTNGDLDTLFKNLPIASLDSIKALTNYVSVNYLNKRVVCTDKARRTLAWKDENRKIIKDKNGALLSKKVKRAGVQNKSLLEGLLHDFDSTIDQTNISDLESINRKNDTVVALTKNNTWFEDEFSKGIVPHAKHVKQFTSIPQAEVENFTKRLKTWCNNFTVNEGKVDLTTFLLMLFRECFNINPNTHHDMLTLYVDTINKKILCFLDCCNCYFCDDADNIISDHKGRITFNIIRLWLRQNMAPSALKKNQAHYFCFSEQDIKEITDEELFESTCFETFYNFIHMNFEIEEEDENAEEEKSF